MSADETPDDVVSVSPLVAAQMYGVSRDFIYDLVRDRLVLSAKAGSRVLVDVESLRDWYESVKRDS